MELTYSKEQIEQVLNMVNTLPLSGINNAEKLINIFNILNSPIKKDLKKDKDKDN